MGVKPFNNIRAYLYMDEKMKENLTRLILAGNGSVVEDFRWLNRAGGTGGAGGAIAPPIFLKIGEKVAFSTPNISRLVFNASQKELLPKMLYTFRRA